MNLDLNAFRAWLATRKGRKGRGFPETTVTAYVRAASAIERDGVGATRHSVLLGAARQLQAWPGTPDELRPVLEALRAEGAATHGRSKPARSIPDGSWLAFTTALEGLSEADSGCAVLRVLSDTGLRIGDVLRLPLVELRVGERSGRLDLTVKGGKERILHWAGAPEAWGALAAHARAARGRGAVTVAHLVSPGSSPLAGDTAYKACARRMALIGREIDSEERWHLHRIRRTVLVRALEETHDIAAVQELGGHDSITTTARYLDEGRAKETAELQRKLTANRRKK